MGDKWSLLGTTFRQWGSQGGGWGVVGVPGETYHSELWQRTIERSVKHVLFASCWCIPSLSSTYLCPIFRWQWVRCLFLDSENNIVCTFANLYVSTFGDVGDEGGIVLLDEEGGEEAWTQTVPAVWTINTWHLWHRWWWWGWSQQLVDIHKWPKM